MRRASRGLPSGALGREIFVKASQSEGTRERVSEELRKVAEDAGKALWWQLATVGKRRVVGTGYGLRKNGLPRVGEVGARHLSKRQSEHEVELTAKS
jgi:hypothetical protein